MSDYPEHSRSDQDGPDPADRIKHAFAKRLHEEKTRSGASLRRLTKLTTRLGHTYPPTSIADRITGRTAVRWDFGETFLRACYLLRDREGDLDLDEWHEDFDEMERQIARLGQGNPEWPRIAGRLPRKAGAYQHRSAAQTARTFLAAHATVVISGLDGVGKTQLAAGIARSVWDAHELDALIWIAASTRATIVAGYAEAARVLRVGGEADAATAADRLLASLGEPNGRRWLTVLDDLTDPGEIRGLWPPTTEWGHTIVTTNRQDAALDGEDRQFLHLGPFEPEEALRYLHRRIRFPSAGRDAARLVAADLGHLPIAMAQATAFMKDRGLDCQAYRDRLHHSRLVDVAPKPLPDDHTEPLVRTWAISVERADELSPQGLARPILELAAQLDPGGIPAEVFTSAAANRHLTRRRGRATTDSDAGDALHCLQRLSLVDFDTSFTRLRINRVLQRAVRESMTPRDATEAALAAADALLACWPDEDQRIEFERVLRANAFALLDHSGDALWPGRLHQVVFQAGNSLSRDGLTAASTDFWERLLPTATARLGADHPDTLTIRNNRAWSYGRAGDPARALHELRALLPARARVLGPDAVNTLATRHGIAFWQHDSGDPAGAVAAMEEVLASYVRVLGPRDRDTLNTRLSLALWRGETDGPEAAITRLRQLADDHRATFGEDRSRTLDVSYHLADWLRRAGRYPEARDLAESLCANSTSALGADHIDTLLARWLLADVLREAGEDKRALDELHLLHTDLVRVHGADHPDARSLAAEIARLSPESR
ncbi:tetratricopeptide repeat protein [Actinoplanes sp. NPDC049599]|uniref:tetratricopeptide repeat protein n=1 Tax=Actinoplanes sp. NPDC049599 TaxID=3363903 RepID=UPI0037AB1452